MLKSHRETSMEDRLRYILSVVNEWLKFAEAKNGALLAVDVAIVFGILQLISNTSSKGHGLGSGSLVGKQGSLLPGRTIP